MKGVRLISRFSEKILIWGNGPKFVHPYSSGSAGRIFLKFCTMKGANRLMKITLIIFQKNNWGKWTILGQKILHPHNSGSAVRIFLTTAP